MSSEREWIHSSGQNRIAPSLSLRLVASVVFPEPGRPQTIINLPLLPCICIMMILSINHTSLEPFRYHECPVQVHLPAARDLTRMQVHCVILTCFRASSEERNVPSQSC